MEREIERDQRRKKVETYPSKEITISITNLIKRDSHQKRFSLVTQLRNYEVIEIVLNFPKNLLTEELLDVPFSILFFILS